MLSNYPQFDDIKEHIDREFYKHFQQLQEQLQLQEQDLPPPPVLRRYYNINMDEIKYAQQIMADKNEQHALIRVYNVRDEFVYFATRHISKIQYDFIISFIVCNNLIQRLETIQILNIINNTKTAIRR